MSLDPITAALDIGKILIEKIWPNPADQAREIRLLNKLAQKGNLAELQAHTAILTAQIKVNEVSASHPSIFVSGARPAAIWAGVFSMSWAGIIHPLLTWVWAFAEMTGDAPPLIESTALSAIVTGLLGVGTMRSYEKHKGVHKDNLKNN
jgi:hypothetical protein